MKLRRMYKNMPKANEPDPMEQMVIAEIDEEEEKRSSNVASSLKSVTDLNWPQEGEFNLTEGEFDYQSGSAGEDEDLL
jgi:hypothetical protein